MRVFVRLPKLSIVPFFLYFFLTKRRFNILFTNRLTPLFPLGFASNIDDLISFLIVSEAERQDVEVMIEHLLNSNDFRRTFWLRNRLFGVSLAVVLVSCVVWCEELMAVVGNEGDQKGFDGMRPCSDVLDVAERVPMLLGIIWFVVLKYQGNLNIKDKFTDMLKGAGALAVVAMMGQVGMFLHFGIAA